MSNGLKFETGDYIGIYIDDEDGPGNSPSIGIEGQLFINTTNI